MISDKIQKAIDAGLFAREMCEIVTPPSAREIDAFASSSNIVLSDSHVKLLRSWGGSNLDEIRIKGLEDIVSTGRGISFADDYNGYIYFYSPDGKVFALDSDGGLIVPLADSLDEFFEDVFLGTKGMHFYGEDWIAELRKHEIT